MYVQVWKYIRFIDLQKASRLVCTLGIIIINVIMFILHNDSVYEITRDDLLGVSTAGFITIKFISRTALLIL